MWGGAKGGKRREVWARGWNLYIPGPPASVQKAENFENSKFKLGFQVDIKVYLSIEQEGTYCI